MQYVIIALILLIIVILIRNIRIVQQAKAYEMLSIVSFTPVPFALPV